MDITDTDKLPILLNRMDHHQHEIQRREETETRLFEWSTALLLGVFAVVIALSDRSTPLSHPILMKLMATLLIAIPTGVFSRRILSETPTMKRQAEVIDKIQNTLRLFDEGAYIPGIALYPERWKNYATRIVRRKTPIYYVAIIAFMTLCVITTVWVAL